ncbi:MAG: MlaD family protein [Sulfuricurvum sp.]|jgi:phospholipid/cholesterol/gamma-HCH transport system substrate-binding protein|uniref:MlaD family protein n=1 Tax=Sulfuricurvum sp. TaxID=2025608 RepID=UPI0025EB743E|nr:MlaD family protein [Sulfuricurvum sp.]MCK9373474.1 MlaD family protein [Sulfuricurvum sp.]
MESKVNYTAVGLFVILFTTALVAFGFWLGKYNGDTKDYRYYKLFITESVAGLSPEAAVKFRGVDVGKVETILINPNNSEEIELTLKIKKETPIKTDSYAILKFYGITGLAYIEIAGGTKESPLLVSDEHTVATIPSSPSLIKRLDESLSNVASKLSTTLDKADRLFNDRNVENVALTLEHLRSLSVQLDGYQNEVRTLIQQTIALENNATGSLNSIQDAADETKKSAANFNNVVTVKMGNTLDSLEKSSRETHALIQKIEQTVDRGDYDLRSVAAPTATEFNELIAQTKLLSNELEQSLNHLKNSPSDLLFKTSKPTPGPGEK